MGIFSNVSINTNNYLNPLKGIKNIEKSSVSPDLCHNADFNLQRRKIHNRNKSENFNSFKGKAVNLEKYFELKKDNNYNNDISALISSQIQSPIHHKRVFSDVTDQNSLLKEKNSITDVSINNFEIKKNFEVLENCNNLFAMKNRRLVKINLYNPKYNQKDIYIGKVSNDCPGWFVNKSLLKENKNIDKEPVFVFSKHNSWLTVTPTRKNRNKSLERMKKMPHDTSAIAPSFMQIKSDHNLPNIFKSVINNSTLMKDKCRGLLVEREIEKPALFNYGTYNHNVHSKEEAVRLNEQLTNGYRRLYPNTQEL